MTKTEKQFNVIIEEGEDGYLLSEVLELPGCHTQAKTLDELMQRTKEAIELCLEANEELVKERFVGLQKIMVSV
ncbi:MAG: type II toxin-antitoxin system HicB family antitoxin [Candidatus Micrarchaeota archaeon]